MPCSGAFISRSTTGEGLIARCEGDTRLLVWHGLALVAHAGVDLRTVGRNSEPDRDDVLRHRGERRDCARGGDGQERGACGSALARGEGSMSIFVLTSVWP